MTKLTVERVAAIIKRYPKVGHLTTADIDDTMYATMLADLVASVLVERGHRYKTGPGACRVPTTATRVEICDAYAVVEREILQKAAPNGRFARRDSA